MKRDERLPLKKLDKTDHQKVEKYLVKLRYLCKKHLGYEYFKKFNFNEKFSDNFI